MAKIITSYASADGTSFESALAADAHDLVLSQKASVDAYAAEAKLGRADATRARRHISGYTAFMAAFDAQAASNEAQEQVAA